MLQKQEVKNYLTPEIDVRRGDVLSAWSGIRPLVKDPNAEDTQSLGMCVKFKQFWRSLLTSRRKTTLSTITMDLFLLRYYIRLSCTLIK